MSLFTYQIYLYTQEGGTIKAGSVSAGTEGYGRKTLSDREITPEGHGGTCSNTLENNSDMHE